VRRLRQRCEFNDGRAWHAGEREIKLIEGGAPVRVVVLPEGLPLAYKVLAGNTADNTTCH